MFLVFTLAFCSIVYEFLLSQVLAALLGGTFIRYTTTIALYIFSLGLGSFYFQKLKDYDSYLSLFRLELLLTAIGASVPVLALAGDLFFSPLFLVWYCYFLVILVGFLSGLELPLLMKISEEKKERGGILALGIDFLGTFAGCLVFPLLLLPKLGLFYTAAFVATLNLLAAVSLMNKVERSRLNWALTAAATLVLLVSYWPQFHHWIVFKVYPA